MTVIKAVVEFHERALKNAKCCETCVYSDVLPKELDSLSCLKRIVVVDGKEKNLRVSRTQVCREYEERP